MTDDRPRQDGVVKGAIVGLPLCWRGAPLLPTLAIVAILGGCATDKPPPVNIQTDSYCRIYKPLGWSKLDTPETVRGILKSNAQFHAACAAPKKGEAKTS